MAPAAIVLRSSDTRMEYEVTSFWVKQEHGKEAYPFCNRSREEGWPSASYGEGDPIFRMMRRLRKDHRIDPKRGVHSESEALAQDLMLNDCSNLSRN